METIFSILKIKKPGPLLMKMICNFGKKLFGDIRICFY